MREGKERVGQGKKKRQRGEYNGRRFVLKKGRRKEGIKGEEMTKKERGEKIKKRRKKNRGDNRQERRERKSRGG